MGVGGPSGLGETLALALGTGSGSTRSMSQAPIRFDIRVPSPFNKWVPWLMPATFLFFSFGADLQHDHDSVHGGCPPRGGRNWIAQQWFTVDSQQAAPRTRGRGAAAAADGVDDGTAVPEARGSEQQAKQQSARAVERLRLELSRDGG